MGDEASAKTLEILQQRVKRQESLLQRCKETIQSHKEQCTLLTSEKEALQEQLDERLQELEKMKVKEHMSLINAAPTLELDSWPGVASSPLQVASEAAHQPGQPNADCPLERPCVPVSHWSMRHIQARSNV